MVVMLIMFTCDTLHNTQSLIFYISFSVRGMYFMQQGSPVPVIHYRPVAKNPTMHQFYILQCTIL